MPSEFVVTERDWLTFVTESSRGSAIVRLLGSRSPGRRAAALIAADECVRSGQQVEILLAARHRVDD